MVSRRPPNCTSRILKAGPLRIVHVHGAALGRRQFGRSDECLAVVRSYRHPERMRVYRHIDILGPSWMWENPTSPLPGTMARGIMPLLTRAALRVYTDAGPRQIVNPEHYQEAVDLRAGGRLPTGTMAALSASGLASRLPSPHGVSTMLVGIVVAMGPGPDFVIGREGKLPWPALPRQLDNPHLRFKPWIVGRKTFESRPADFDIPIVLTRNPVWEASLSHRAGSLDEALKLAADMHAGEVIIAGGAEVFAAALPLARRLYLTEVEGAVEGDAHFPPWDRTVWTELHAEMTPAKDGAPALRFSVWEKLP